MTVQRRVALAAACGVVLLGEVLMAGVGGSLAATPTTATATTSPGHQPTITFAPAHGLRDGTLIDVRGTNYPSHAYPVSLIECQLASRGTFDCAAPTLRIARADAQGSFRVKDYKVHRHITTLVGRAVDCAIENCQLSVQDLEHFPALTGSIVALPFGPPIHVRAVLASHTVQHAGPTVVVIPIRVTCSRTASTAVYGHLQFGASVADSYGFASCGPATTTMNFGVTSDTAIPNGPGTIALQVSATAGNTTGYAPEIDTTVTMK